MAISLSKLENDIGYTFKDKKLLSTAVTHSSYVHELQVKGASDNERLEFLGDAVLELVSSEFMFEKCKKFDEGRLTKLRASAVCETALYEHAKLFDLGSYIKLGAGAKQQGGADRPSIVSDACEALIAAIYLDGGLDCARKFILEKILFDIDPNADVTDPKTAISQYFQAKTTHETVKYVIVSESGKSNDKTYIVQAYVGNTLLEKGVGKSVRAAERDAAEKSLKELNKETLDK